MTSWHLAYLRLGFKAESLQLLTVFENYQKCPIWTSQFWLFQRIIVLLKVACLVTLFGQKNLKFRIFALSSIFCRMKIDLSGNTVSPQASGFQKIAKTNHFGHFRWTFVHSKCKRSSLRSQCWMRLFYDFQTPCLYGSLIFGFLHDQILVKQQ